MRLVTFVLTFTMACAFAPSITLADETYVSNTCALNIGVSTALTHQRPQLKWATFRKTAIAFPYAAQPWIDEEVGGVALLKYDPVKGWVVLPGGGGGGMDMFILMKNHVPHAKAAQLMTELNSCR